jgi:hypothetical protein
LSKLVSALTDIREHKHTMHNRMKPLALILILFAAGPAGLSAFPAPVLAHEEHDEDRARHALEAGEVIPLDRILAALGNTAPGEISAVELERENGIWIYEFKVISPEGRMVTVRVDAKTAKPVKPVKTGS